MKRQEVADAVTGLGWRNVLGKLCTHVRVGSVVDAADVAGRIVGAVGPDVDEHVQVDVRADRAIVTVWSSAAGAVTRRDVDIAGRITELVAELGLRTDAGVGGSPRPAQLLEIAIDAMDIPLIRPFWKAVLGYVDEVAGVGLVDPLWQGPAVWFQQMDEPRVQRNRIHLDVSVPHDEALRRIRAAVEAGGTVLSDAEAPAFWVLADAEGNEACVTTWQGRD